MDGTWFYQYSLSHNVSIIHHRMSSSYPSHVYKNELAVLGDHVDHARSKRFEHIGWTEQTWPYDHPALSGECHKNTVQLCEQLDQYSEYTPIIVWGAIDDPDVGRPPRTVPEAEICGQVHFWVEVPTKKTTYILDISSELPSRHGKPYVSPDLPDLYHRPDYCRLRYDQSITSDDLLNVSDYIRLVDNNYRLSEEEINDIKEANSNQH